MGLLIRKVDIAKWRQPENSENWIASADAVTICMKTSGNTLSFWYIEDETKLDEAALAIVGIGNRLDSLDLMIFELDYFEENHFSICENDGNTFIERYRNFHRDLTELNVDHLVNLSAKSIELVKAEKVERYTVGRLKALLKKELDLGLSSIKNFPESIQEKMISSFPELEPK